MRPFISKASKLAAGILLLQLAYLRGFVGSALLAPVRRIRQRSDGADPNQTSHKLAIYVTFDRHSQLHDFVVLQVAELARTGCRIVFISASPRLSAVDVARVAPHVWLVLHRRNVGHDFGCYRDGLREIATLPAVDSVILMNDSCYGPFGDLARIDARARASGADLFGITESWWHQYHVQTYFLWLAGSVVRSGPFVEFWRSLLPYQPRKLVIRTGEIAFTQRMLRAGFTAKVLCPYEDVARAALHRARERLRSEHFVLLPAERRYLLWLAQAISEGAHLNPTHTFWDTLIGDYDCPFIKRDLLRRNPLNIPGLLEWSALLARREQADIGVIHAHLKVSR